MSNESIFILCNTLALLGWIALFTLPKNKWSKRSVQPVIVTLLTLIYTMLVIHTLTFDDLQSFGSLAGVMKLFTNSTAVLAGWVHYLAFDLMIGLYILNSGQKHLIHHALLIPCLIFAFMLGPVGLLFFTIVRSIKTRKYWVTYT